MHLTCFWLKTSGPGYSNVDSAIRQINHYPVDTCKYWGNQLRSPLDRDLSSEQRYPPFEQLGPDIL